MYVAGCGHWELDLRQAGFLVDHCLFEPSVMEVEYLSGLCRWGLLARSVGPLEGYGSLRRPLVQKGGC